MKTKKSGAKFSSIVQIGTDIKKLSQETGKEYLPLNRGVNAVTLIDLESISKYLNYNSVDMQVYPPNNGRKELLDAINTEYFNGNSKTDNFCITNGGMNALNLIISTLDIDGLVVSDYYWGAYRNICLVYNIPLSHYTNFDNIKENIENLKNKAVIICDPNNPIGNSYTDDELLDIISFLNSNDVVVIFDSPYRKLFTEDISKDHYFYNELLNMDNVIISESFSKSIGLSGQRLGFIHSTNEEFNKEISIKFLYDSNGSSSSSQIIVEKLLTTIEGKKAVDDFKRITKDGIKRNINFLKENNLLADEFYNDSHPVGIFVVIKKSYEELLQNRIGSVPLEFFTPNKISHNRSRICVSVDPEKFGEFFNPIV